MSTGNRFVTVLAAKVNKLLGRFEDPKETLDLSYEKQVELLTNVKKSITELATSKFKLDKVKHDLCQSVIGIDEQATQLLQQGNENLAREVLERKVSTQEQIKSVTEQIKKMKADQEKLTEKQKVLEIRVQQFAATKETMKAQLEAAEASEKISSSITGIDNAIGNPAEAMRRAKDKTDQLNARSDAIGELVDTGVLDDSLGTETAVERNLNSAKRKGQVDKEMEALRKKAGLQANDLNSLRD